MDEIDLDGRVQAVREWHEGFEELEAIPHSFAILLSNGQGSMSMFANTDDEKVYTCFYQVSCTILLS